MSKYKKLALKNQVRLLEQSTEIASTPPDLSGDINYMAKLFSQTYLPYRKIPEKQKIFTNGNVKLLMGTNADFLPYGSIPRLILSWIITQAVLSQDRTINLGHNLRGFLKELGLDTNGRKYRQIEEQIKALFRVNFEMSFWEVTEEKKIENQVNFFIVDKSSLWWNKEEQDVLFDSEIVLSEAFFNICKKSFPVDKRALRYLKKAPLSLDVYFWLSYRIFNLRKPTLISWRQLKEQFGSEYKNDRRTFYIFKKKLEATFEEIKALYPQLNLEAQKEGIQLKPSHTFIKKITSQY